MKTIEIIVSPQGKNTVTTRGFAGGECREASKFIEQTLGQQTDGLLTAELVHRHAGKATSSSIAWIPD